MREDEHQDSEFFLLREKLNRHLQMNCGRRAHAQSTTGLNPERQATFADQCTDAEEDLLGKELPFERANRIAKEEGQARKDRLSSTRF
jgi:hypothetical protein